MTTPKGHWYLIAYDVRDPRRLQRLHYYLRKHATALQESVFAIHADAAVLAEVERGIRERTNPREDDLRLYAIPGPAAVWAAGAQTTTLNGFYAPPGAHEAPQLSARLRRWVRGLMSREAA
jgi:CRISPR-associated protein Cas2